MSRFKGQRKLYRNRRRGFVGGVCAGLADYFELDIALVRILFVVALIMTLQVALIFYIIAWFVLDNDPQTLTDDDGRLINKIKMKSHYERKSVIKSVEDRFDKIERRMRGLEAYVTSKPFKLRDEFDKL